MKPILKLFIFSLLFTALFASSAMAIYKMEMWIKKPSLAESSSSLLPGWSYRKEIQITNSGNDLIDYQILVNSLIYNEDKLVGSWHFDNGTITTVHDSSEYNNTGITPAPSGNNLYTASYGVIFSDYTVPDTGQVVSVSIYVYYASGNVTVGIYSDNAGVPDKLLATSQSATVVSGWNTLNLTVPVNVTAGTTIWIAHQFSGSASTFYQTGGAVKDRYVANAYSNGLPTSVGTTTAFGVGTSFSIYENSQIWTTGMFGNARSFDGSSLYASVPGSSSLNITGNMSIEAWVYTKSSAIQGIVDNTQYKLVISTSSNNVDFVIYNLAGAYTFVRSVGTLSTNAWHHVVGVNAGTNLYIYIDGKLDNTAFGSGGTTTYTIETLYIGSMYGGSTSLFNGTLDEIRIYGRALSGTEISDMYQAKAKLNYDDVRFTDSDGTTLLNYWKEADGKFWVKVPSIPYGNKTIYVNYGNPSATSASNESVLPSDMSSSVSVSGESEVIKCTSDSIDFQCVYPYSDISCPASGTVQANARTYKNTTPLSESGWTDLNSCSAGSSCGSTCSIGSGQGISNGLGNCYIGFGTACSLNGAVPLPDEGYSRVWVGSSSSPRPSGVYKSGTTKVCHPTSCTQTSSSSDISGSFASVTYPIGPNNNTKSFKTGDTFNITIPGITTSNSWVPLVECKLDKFNSTGQSAGGVYFDSWSAGTVVFNYTISPTDFSGNWNVSYCGIFSDFAQNNGWPLQSNNSNGTSFKVSTGLVVT